MAILGIDEVGRGPWAGPLVIGAVILPKNEAGNYPDWVARLTDSKKLSLKKREELSAIILEKALATGLGWVSSKEIDELGLSASLRLATRRAVEAVQKQKVPFTEIIIDGTVNFLKGTKLENHVTILKKGDLLIKEISAASIIAKVARDNYMKDLAKRYPDYGFDKHVGYGTKLHQEMLAKLGPCSEHRFSFGPVTVASGEKCLFEGLKTWPSGPERPKNRPSTASGRMTTKQLGDCAENIVADYLGKQGHRIVARNHKTRFYEIDIVSIKDDKIYFTEVKYRKTQDRGTSLDMITKQKLKRMAFAAESFLKCYKEYGENYSPLLAAGIVSGNDFTFDDWLIIK